jgi:hypothetical protein
MDLQNLYIFSKIPQKFTFLLEISFFFWKIGFVYVFVEN